MIGENDNYPPLVLVSIFGQQWADFTQDTISKACFCDKSYPPDNGNMVRWGTVVGFYFTRFNHLQRLNSVTKFSVA